MDPATITAVIAAVASTVGLLVTSLRKREDTTVEELRLRAKNEHDDHEETKKELEAEKATSAGLRGDVRTQQNVTIMREQELYLVRMALAAHGVKDPTSSIQDTVAGKSPGHNTGKVEPGQDDS